MPAAPGRRPSLNTTTPFNGRPLRDALLAFALHGRDARHTSATLDTADVRKLGATLPIGRKVQVIAGDSDLIRRHPRRWQS